MSDDLKITPATLKRLPIYLRILKEKSKEGFNVSDDREQIKYILLKSEEFVDGFGKKDIKNRAELYQNLIEDNRINIKAIDILFKEIE